MGRLGKAYSMEFHMEQSCMTNEHANEDSVNKMLFLSD